MRIAVVGGGFSGTLTSLNLARELPEAEIFLFEKSGVFGPGLAYGTDSPQHLLNVPAGKLGAFPDRVDDFYRWLKSGVINTEGVTFSESSFVPRAWYGKYVSQLLASQAAGSGAGSRQSHPHLVLCHKEVCNIANLGQKLEIELTTGEKNVFDFAILCLGNFPPPFLSSFDPSLKNSAAYIGNPWLEDLNNLKPNDSVAIVGTGLTMIDVALEMRRLGKNGKIIAFSRHGNLPSIHDIQPNNGAASPRMPALPISPRVLFSALKEQLAGPHWRSVVDALRPHTQNLWQSWSSFERGQFLRHLRSRWEVARHRIAPQLMELVAKDKNLHIVRAKLRSATAVADGVVVRFGSTPQLVSLPVVPNKPTTAAAASKQNFAENSLPLSQEIKVSCLINCTGPISDIAKLSDPLVAALRATGALTKDEFGLGALTHSSGALISQSGAISANIFTIGSFRKASLWESTAVPELRVQAAEIAKVLSKCSTS